MRFILFLFVLAVVGCGDGVAPIPADAVADDAFETLSSLSLGDVDDSYARLNGFAFTAKFSLEEIDGFGRVTSSTSRTVRRTPAGNAVGETVLEADSFATLSNPESFEGPLRPKNPLLAILSDEPAYVSARTRDRYTYQARPDTTMDNERLRVVQATLLPESVDEQPVRYARYYIGRGNKIVGVDALRITSSALFSETSHAKVWLQHFPDGTLLPHTAVSETTILSPGKSPRHLRLTHEIRDISSVE